MGKKYKNTPIYIINVVKFYEKNMQVKFKDDFYDSWKRLNYLKLELINPEDISDCNFKYLYRILESFVSEIKMLSEEKESIAKDIEEEYVEGHSVNMYTFLFKKKETYKELIRMCNNALGLIILE